MDGRFLTVKEAPADTSAQRLVLVVGWFDELKRLVPVK